jgi:hypothetical protein
VPGWSFADAIFHAPQNEEGLLPFGDYVAEDQGGRRAPWFRKRVLLFQVLQGLCRVFAQ